MSTAITAAANAYRAAQSTASKPASSKTAQNESQPLPAGQVLEKLKELFPKTQFHTASWGSPQELESLAKSYGKGRHLVLSGKFLENMGKDDESFQKGLALIGRVVLQLSEQEAAGGGTLVGTGAAIHENGNVQQWAASLPVKPENPIDALMKTKKEEKKKVKYPLNYNPRRILRQLATANSSRSMGGLRFQAAKLLSEMMNCQLSENYDTNEARKAVANARKVLQCISRKERHLRQEELLKQQAKRASENRERRKAFRRSLELKTRRKLHRIGEFGQQRDAWRSIPRSSSRGRYPEEEYESPPQLPVLPGAPVDFPAAGAGTGADTGGGLVITFTASFDLSV